MKIAILCQEEPLFLGPFLQQVIRSRPEKIVALFVAGHRTGGEKKKTWKQFWRSIKTYWYIFEPLFFFWALYIKLRITILGKYDPRSVEGLAAIFNIPVYKVGDPNSKEFHDLLRKVEADIVLNQTELLLKRETLDIPSVGFLNRHASLLPHFRGRLASFWAHAHEPPSHGITIHFVDEGIDTGDIILQHEFLEIKGDWDYGRVMDHMQKKAPSLFWRAVKLLQDESFEPTVQPSCAEEAYKFPKLKDALAYHERMQIRRGLRPKVRKDEGEDGEEDDEQGVGEHGDENVDEHVDEHVYEHGDDDGNSPAKE